MAKRKYVDEARWKSLAVRNPGGYYDLKTEDTGDVPVRIFFTPELLASAEDQLYQQIVNATRFPAQSSSPSRPTRTTATASPSAASS